MKKILFDIASGELANDKAIEIAIKFANDFPSTNLVLVGAKNDFNNFKLPKNIETIFAQDVVSMNDPSPLTYRLKPNSSLAIGLKECAQNKDVVAMLSSANTGAYISGAFLVVKPFSKNIRPAFAGILNLSNNVIKILLDLGAMSDCDGKTLYNFGIMGSIYYSVLSKNNNSKVALLANGTEDFKGSKASKEAFLMLKKDKAINFVGNLEATDLDTNKADVFVMDGFVGNVLLKSIEFTGKYFAKNLKQALTKNPFRKILTLLNKKAFNDFKKNVISAENNGGAVVLGLNKLVFKAHGSANQKQLYKSLTIIDKLIKGDVVKKIKDKAKNETT